ncbi:MAG TPA: hypothetical protein P5531_03820 [Bacteroidales bacterium]|nr:hypothetical protein [Bacteroidales bacterium]
MNNKVNFTRGNLLFALKEAYEHYYEKEQAHPLAAFLRDRGVAYYTLFASVLVKAGIISRKRSYGRYYYRWDSGRPGPQMVEMLCNMAMERQCEHIIRRNGQRTVESLGYLHPKNTTMTAGINTTQKYPVFVACGDAGCEKTKKQGQGITQTPSAFKRLILNIKSLFI